MKSFRSLFDRCGTGTLSDLSTPEWRILLAELARQQAEFLERETLFRSPEYSWPRDSLHTWSRIWEYPYVFHHLRSRRFTAIDPEQPTVLDVGSGVTFFPFSVARLGCRVVCTDIDPICEKDMRRAAECVPHAPGSVRFRLADGQNLPFGDGEFDIAYCISVLEHVPTFRETVMEIARVLKPGGLFLLTFDLDLRGDSELGVSGHRQLMACLEEQFRFLHPVMAVHPADVLNTVNGPLRYPAPVGLGKAIFLAKQWLIRPLLGRKPKPLVPCLLAVQGFALLRPGR